MDLFGWFRRRSRREQELDEEIRAHLTMAIRERIERGEDPAEAEMNARREFGNSTQVREVTREMWGRRWLDELVQDLRFGLRQLRRNPGFTAVAVITLALGIGANSAIFSIFTSVYLAHPPVQDPDRVVVVGGKAPHGSWSAAPVSSADFADGRSQSNVFTSLAASAPADDMDIVVHGAPVDVAGMRVTRNYFHVLGRESVLGSGFSAQKKGGAQEDDEVILSDSLWRQLFGADPHVVGSALVINGKSFTVVGVMPGSFKFWAGPAPWYESAQLWVPLTGPPSRKSRFLLVIGRLKPGVSLGRASAEMATIAARLSREYPKNDKNWSAGVLSLQDYRARGLSYVGGPLAIEMPAVFLVLLIACANIAGLLLARSASRSQELAIRAALGAGRGRLIRQLVSESVALGAAAGLFLAWGGIRVLHSWIGFDPATRAMPLVIDWNVVGFTVAIAVFAVVLSALLPALGASRADPDAALKAGSRTGSVAPRARARRVLVGGEIALAVVLLAGASVIIRSVVSSFTSSYGFNAQGIWSFNVNLREATYRTPASRVRFFQTAVRRVAVIPGVSSAAVVNGLPVALPNGVPFSVTGDFPSDVRKSPWASYYDVSTGYFQTMQIRVLRGRAFNESDLGDSATVAIINEALARGFLAGKDPVGSYIRLGSGAFITLSGALSPQSAQAQPRRIVGVVANVKDWIGQRQFNPQVYVPMQQAPMSEAIMAIRWKGGSPPQASLVNAVWSAGSANVTVGAPASMAQVINSLGGGEEKLIAKLMGTFALLALLLAAVGTYGVIAYVVARRTHEIGIRVALGARRADVLALILREAAVVGGCGLIVGLCAAAGMPRLLGSVFFGISGGGQGPVLAGVAVVMLAVVLTASYIPARRAMKVDPLEALRYE